DALTREVMGFDLLHIFSERPKTVVFITHSVSDAALLSDRVLVMTGRPGSILTEVTVPIRAAAVVMPGNASSCLRSETGVRLCM
ncbi:hypothetical protein ACC791_37245, partial [Rhizobium ruizarguesonis]